MSLPEDRNALFYLNHWQSYTPVLDSPGINEPAIRVDSPLQSSSSPPSDAAVPVRTRSKPRRDPVQAAPVVAPPSMAANLVFVDNNTSRNPRERKLIRRHVMKDYLVKASRDPTNTDPRVPRDHDLRPRKKTSPSKLATRKRPRPETHDCRNPDSSPLASSPAEHVTDRSNPPKHRTVVDDTDDHAPFLVNIDSAIGRVGYFSKSLDEIPGSLHIPPVETLPISSFGSELQPFQAWPTLWNHKLNINKLKYSCGVQFASAGLVADWLPTLLQAQPAFLSTICISASHDDIMQQACKPVSERSSTESYERTEIRAQVMPMIRKVMQDPLQRASDATIVAVLQLLTSEIMGCDSAKMKINQDGLDAMIFQRGGLAKLGMRGQLSSIMTITMYLISALRETLPGPEYRDYALEHRIHPLSHASKFPVSPVFCPDTGFTTLKRSPKHPPSTWSLLEDIRQITLAFSQRSDSRIEGLSPNASGHSLSDGAWELHAKILAYPPALQCYDNFGGLNERYTYEALRLAGCVYATALAAEIPISKASATLASRRRDSGNASDVTQNLYSSPQSLPGTTKSDESNTPIHVLIQSALLRTNMTKCWGPLSGILFWIAVVGAACGNQESTSSATSHYNVSSSHSRTGVDSSHLTAVHPAPFSTSSSSPQPPPIVVDQEYEDARKVLSSIAVRCSILTGFEHGRSVLESLRRIVAIEQVLLQAERDRHATNGSQHPGHAISNGTPGPRTPDSGFYFVDHYQTSTKISGTGDHFPSPHAVLHDGMTPNDVSPAVSIRTPFYGPPRSRQQQLGFGDFALDFQI